MENFLKIISKPDNVAIVIMLLMVAFYTWWAFHQSFENDRRKREGLPVEGEDDKKIEVWHSLVRIEMLVTMVVIVGLIIWSLVLDAPIEELANPTLTPNPAKAPWYFLGLPSLFFSFYPFISFFLLPLLIFFFLISIPYFSINPNFIFYYTFS